jgi:hypothetical protein
MRVIYNNRTGCFTICEEKKKKEKSTNDVVLEDVESCGGIDNVCGGWGECCPGLECSPTTGKSFNTCKSMLD